MILTTTDTGQTKRVKVIVFGSPQKDIYASSMDDLFDQLRYNRNVQGEARVYDHTEFSTKHPPKDYDWLLEVDTFPEDDTDDDI